MHTRISLGPQIPDGRLGPICCRRPANGGGGSMPAHKFIFICQNKTLQLKSPLNFTAVNSIWLMWGKYRVECYRASSPSDWHESWDKVHGSRGCAEVSVLLWETERSLWGHCHHGAASTAVFKIKTKWDCFISCLPNTVGKWRSVVTNFRMSKLNTVPRMTLFLRFALQLSAEHEDWLIHT